MNMEIAIRGALGTQLFEYLCGLDFAQGAGQTVEKITISTGGKVVAPVKVDWLSQIIEVPYPINVGLGTAKQDVWKRPEVFKSLASSNIIKNQFGEIFVARISSSSSATTTVGGVKCASTTSESFYALFFLATATTRRWRRRRSRCSCRRRRQKQINIGQKPKHALLPVSGDLIHGWRVVRVGPTVPSVLPRDWIWRHHATKIDRR